MKFQFIRDDSKFKFIGEDEDIYNLLSVRFKELLKEENIQNIKADVLLFQAGKDTFVKPNGHNKFVSLAKNCEFVRFEDAKHEIYIEKDEIFNPYIEKVLGFYDK